MSNASKNDMRITLPVGKLRFYLNEWRQEEGWPAVEVSLLLALYDLLLIADTPEDVMADAFGADGVEFITSLVDSPNLLCAGDIPPWDPYPCLANHQ